MQKRTRILTTLALWLSIAVTGAWADEVQTRQNDNDSIEAPSGAVEAVADEEGWYVNANGEVKPLLEIIALLIRRGVEVRLIHAKEPGQNFRDDFDRFPTLYDRLERALCPRVHFKIIVFDCKEVYVGSANLTGAGLGMKASTTRNFEAGILTDDAAIVEQAMNQFDDVWIGKHCQTCKRKEVCLDPIA